MFPNAVLSRQFWTDKQRKSALDRMLAYRTQVYPQLAVSLLKSLDNQEMDKKLSQTSCDIVNQVSFKSLEGNLIDIICFWAAKHLRLILGL